MKKHRARVGVWLGIALVLILTGCHQAQTAATLTVGPSTSAIDQSVSIVFHGPAAAHVTITAAATDSTGRAWQSKASFIADAGGTVDTARDTATGSYNGVFADGLISMMTPVTSPSGAAVFVFSMSKRIGMRFVAQVDGSQVAETTVYRSALDNIMRSTTTLKGQGFDATFYRPTSSGSHPAVVLLGGSEGGNSGTLEAALLARHGIAALSVAYFNSAASPNQFPGLPDTLSEIPLEYFTKPLRWIRQQPGIDTQHVWLSGVSRGSEAAMLVASDFPQLVNGVIAAVPTNTVHCALTGGPGGDCRHSAWTLAGKPVPFSTENNNPQPTDVAASVIQVEKITGPLIAVCGGQDLLWTSCPYSQAILKRLADHHRPYARQLLSYPNAGHGVGSLVPYVPYVRAADNLPIYGATPDANAVAPATPGPKSWPSSSITPADPCAGTQSQLTKEAEPDDQSLLPATVHTLARR